MINTIYFSWYYKEKVGKKYKKKIKVKLNYLVNYSTINLILIYLYMDLQDSNVQTSLSSEVDIVVPTQESIKDPVNFMFFDAIQFIILIFNGH